MDLFFLMFVLLFSRAVSQSGATYLITMMSVSVDGWLAGWLYVCGIGPPPREFRQLSSREISLSYMHVPGSFGSCESEFPIHFYVFCNSQMAVSP